MTDMEPYVPVPKVLKGEVLEANTAGDPLVYLDDPYVPGVFGLSYVSEQTPHLLLQDFLREHGGIAKVKQVHGAVILFQMFDGVLLEMWHGGEDDDTVWVLHKEGS